MRWAEELEAGTGKGQEEKRCRENGWDRESVKSLSHRTAQHLAAAMAQGRQFSKPSWLFFIHSELKHQTLAE